MRINENHMHTKEIRLGLFGGFSGLEDVGEGRIFQFRLLRHFPLLPSQLELHGILVAVGIVEQRLSRFEVEPLNLF